MDVLIIGSGGREHALAQALHEDPSVDGLHAAPGNVGMDAIAEAHEVDELDPDAVAALAAKLAVDLVVVGPEAPLVAGVADAVRAGGIACFGPSEAAARIEGSKAFAKEVMAQAGVPTAMAHVCDSEDLVIRALDAFGPPYVVKDDGLAGGKGVVVTEDRSAALAHARRCGRLVIEEHLDGPEVSLFCLSDGHTVVPLLPAQDFKRAGDGDTGPNTGGMGAYTPLSWAPPGLVDNVVERIAQPTIEALAHRGTPFVGCLYVGLALTSRGMRVVEFNCRFGDPETQALLALLRTPMGGLLHAAALGRLGDQAPLSWADGAAVTVVLAAAGYPEAPRKGAVIEGLDEVAELAAVRVAHAGTSVDAAGRVIADGGRVLAVTATGSDLRLARDRAYDAAARIHIDGAFHRQDIALAASYGEVTVPAAP